MIPNSITAAHIRAAINYIRKNGIPGKRESTGYDLLDDGRLYPPKYVISLAALNAMGEKLNPATFSGGQETNTYLENLGFKIRAKNQDWNESECYFAVWGYDQLDLDRDMVKKELYREISRIISRSEKSVEFKIQNVSAFDKRPRKQKPISEAPNAQQLLGKVFDWYWRDREAARQLYPKYYEQFAFSLAPLIEAKQQSFNPKSLTFLVEEGAPSPAAGLKRKRSQKLIELGRAHFKRLDAEGKLRCRACGFTAPESIEVEIVQLHHVEPIADSGSSGRKLSFQEAVNQLVPLCPTCHALAHTGRPPLSADSVRNLRKTREFK